MLSSVSRLPCNAPLQLAVTGSMSEPNCAEHQYDARGKIENYNEEDWFNPLHLPFKRKNNVSAGMAASKPHPWKRLRQLIAAENYGSVPVDVPTYVSIEAPPSMYPAKRYCDITGYVAKYIDPKTQLRYANPEAFRIARSLTPEDVQARLAVRNANNNVVK
eukprot:GHRR01017994.1.p1 GENE.GHRR01017994.1~~GHRR01017994.1.p1  ORF type:complete len:161 (+),score=24.59 GHRR01017994.1:105-587(+)